MLVQDETFRICLWAYFWRRSATFRDPRIRKSCPRVSAANAALDVDLDHARRDAQLPPDSAVGVPRLTSSSTSSSRGSALPDGPAAAAGRPRGGILGEEGGAAAPPSGGGGFANQAPQQPGGELSVQRGLPVAHLPHEPRPGLYEARSTRDRCSLVSLVRIPITEFRPLRKCPRPVGCVSRACRRAC